ncbi:MAG: serine--tRNA ligase [Candidatus Nephthysia bennettiae]|uniref:Serine--tRNA ligase n=1 Tax=Candidatus Nephthysia bennettiae TaxID=3127016 RepID=A0A934K894_9BACT|nr:serine--tRNA ligase [Candidatus Dormibacteraeota bacterium]MBJ7613887.1 serine--tRNA ligase [Candidatus Dormibacteraeota bacterium]PZR97990.1 MAG: serine--tRNA ligase [Candidatus Dormibacteraeota bacterium]
MLPIELIRRNPDEVRRAARLKGEEAPVDEILELDDRWRQATTEAESTRAEQNLHSKEFARSKDPSLLPQMRELAERAKRLAALADDLLRERDELLLRVPNVFHESVPVGESEADNVVIREWGSKPSFEFEPRPHYEIGEALGIMDFERAARVSGSRFAFLTGAGARLERALVQFMLDLHTGEHGYTEVYSPLLVNSASMVGTAQLPKFAEDAFRVEGRDLWLIPTAEVPVTNLHRQEILDAAQLPLKYVCYSPCFRSEAGAAGKDTRGYIRMHQFSKVELVRLVEPENSLEALEELTSQAEEVLRRLGLHYQVMVMCTGDMGFAQYKKYDLNVWAPGLGRYLEVSSCSLFTDFQARRASLRYRAAPGRPPRFVHTLNGSALALTRTLDAVLETYQRGDGGVDIPEVLRPYFGGRETISSS